MAKPLFRIASIDQAWPRLAQSLRTLRVESDGGPKGLQRFVVLCLAREAPFPGCSGPSQNRDEAGGAAKAFGGLVEPAERLQCQAEIVECLGVIGMKTQGRLATVDGLFILAQRAMGLGHIGVKDSRPRSHGHGPADQLDGPAGMAALVMHHTEEMQGVGMFRLASQQAMVKSSGIGITARVDETRAPGSGPNPWVQVPRQLRSSSRLRSHSAGTIRHGTDESLQ